MTRGLHFLSCLAKNCVEELLEQTNEDMVF